MAARVILLIPVLTLAWVGVLVLWIGAPRPVLAARVWGGPTDGLARWTGWVEAGAVSGSPSLAGARVQVTAESNGSVIQDYVELDADGQAEVVLDFGRAAPGAFRIVVHEADRMLCSGNVQLSVRDWQARASRRGGYLRVTSRGQGTLHAAAGRGAFAVPFTEPLWIRLEHPQGRALPGARISVASGGAAVRPAEAVTDTWGIARTTLTPAEHGVTLIARAELGAVGRAELSASIPVIPGALHAERRGRELHVASPIERPAAYVTLVSEKGRHSGARVPLTADATGIARGVLTLSDGLPDQVWAVVESARAAPSGLRVGWPLFEVPGEPTLTFDVPDGLLLDGFAGAARRENQRQLAVRQTALMIGLLGALLSALSVAWRARQERRRFRAHLGGELSAEAAERVVLAERIPYLLAIILILLGFLITAAVLSARLG